MMSISRADCFISSISLSILFSLSNIAIMRSMSLLAARISLRSLRISLCVFIANLFFSFSYAVGDAKLAVI